MTKPQDSALSRHLDAVVPIAIGVICLVLAAFGERARLLLRYERDALVDGELWRAVTAHLVHLGLVHTVLNVAGLALIAGLFRRELTPAHWLGGGLVAALTISGALAVLQPQTLWYVGLSGVLHGWYAIGAARVCEYQRGFGVAMLLALAVKLGYENILGTMPFTTALEIGPVVVVAHLYGAAGGLLFYVTLRIGKLVGVANR